MKKQIIALTVSIISTVYSAHAASANCLASFQNERLFNKCLLMAMNNKVATKSDVVFLDRRLKQSGYTQGLGFPGAVPPFSIQAYATPILSYSNDINGGNIDRPLILGALTFYGDENLIRKRGVLIGADVGANGRYIYGEGRVLDFGLRASQGYSPKYNLGITSFSGSVCSNNHIRNWWYIDICANESRTRKQLSEDLNSSLNLTLSKIFSTPSQQHYQASLGVQRYIDGTDTGYEQNRITLGLDMLSGNGVYSSVNVKWGNPVEKQLALNREINASISMLVKNRPLTFSVGYKLDDGGLLLGFKREDRTAQFGLTYQLWQNVGLSVGYSKTNSTIEYFDVSEPTVSLQFSRIQF